MTRYKKQSLSPGILPKNSLTDILTNHHQNKYTVIADNAILTIPKFLQSSNSLSLSVRFLWIMRCRRDKWVKSNINCRTTEKKHAHICTAKTLPLPISLSQFATSTLDISNIADIQTLKGPNLSQLLNGLFCAFKTAVDNVDSIRLWILNVLLHEAAKTRKICSNTRNSHDSAFR